MCAGLLLIWKRGWVHFSTKIYWMTITELHLASISIALYFGKCMLAWYLSTECCKHRKSNTQIYLFRDTFLILTFSFTEHRSFFPSVHVQKQTYQLFSLWSWVGLFRLFTLTWIVERTLVGMECAKCKMFSV